MSAEPVALLHYSAPPIIGGVEQVMSAHARQFLQRGHAVTFIAGQGEEQALPEWSELALIPELSSHLPEISRAENPG